MGNANAELAHLVVAGGGIAGLATAEIFARSGYQVVLLEKQNCLCAESSGKQHGWFHMGSLYSINRDATFLRTTVRNCQTLLSFYRDFAGMNLGIDHENGALISKSPDGASPWFNDEQSRLLFLQDNNLLREDEAAFYKYHKIPWHTALRLFRARHNRYRHCDWRNGSAAAYIPSASFNDEPRAEDPALGIDPAEVTRLLGTPQYSDNNVLGYDRSMNADSIVHDLLRSLLFHGGEVRTSAEVVRHRRAFGQVLVDVKSRLDGSEDVVRCERFVQAKGRGLNLGIMKEVYFAKVNTRASPLLLTTPPLFERNFQLVTPVSRRSMNHIRHSWRGQPYSLVGDNSTADPGNQGEIDEAEAHLLATVRNLVPEFSVDRVWRVYTCYKTELLPSLDVNERNYSYIIEEVDDQVHVIIPGKFSLCFELAVNVFRKLTGYDPCPIVDASYIDMEVDAFVRPLHHQNIVSELVAGSASGVIGKGHEKRSAGRKGETRELGPGGGPNPS